MLLDKEKGLWWEKARDGKRERERDGSVGEEMVLGRERKGEKDQWGGEKEILLESEERKY